MVGGEIYFPFGVLAQERSAVLPVSWWDGPGEAGAGGVVGWLGWWCGGGSGGGASTGWWGQAWGEVRQGGWFRRSPVRCLGRYFGWCHVTCERHGGGGGDSQVKKYWTTSKTSYSPNPEARANREDAPLPK